MRDINYTADDIIDFWAKAGRIKWFGKDDDFNQNILTKYRQLWQMAVAGRLDSWGETAKGALALTLILDQFSRRMFHDDARSFCGDRYAQKIAKLSIEQQLDLAIEPQLRGFLYMPFRHSEKFADQQKSIHLFTALGDKTMLQYAKLHYQIISWFGRFPNRNILLGRRTTHEEQAFLNASNFVL